MDEARDIAEAERQEFNIALHAALNTFAKAKAGKEFTSHYAQAGQYGKDTKVLMRIRRKETWDIVLANPNEVSKQGLEGNVIITETLGALLDYAARLEGIEPFVVWQTDWKPSWHTNKTERMLIYPKESKKNG